MNPKPLQIFFVPLMFLLTFISKAQHTYYWYGQEVLNDIKGKKELTVTLGANNFLGDIGGNQGIGKPYVKDYTFKTIRPLVGIAFSIYEANWYKITAGINVTRAVAIDSLIPAKGGMERWRIYRNLSFRSDIEEAYVATEIYPFTALNYFHTMRRVNPFFSTGVGVFHFNPKAKLAGEWVALQPLRLEGQGFEEYPARKPYKRTQIYIPFSVGLKYFLNNYAAVSLSATARQTFTDYIDDISTSYIDPNLFDKYLPSDKAGLARQLYSRSVRPEKVRPDIVKADSKDRDSYLTFNFGMSFILEKRLRIYYGGM